METSDGTRLIGLVTTRRTGRWVLPKGWTEKGRTASKTAAREAREEAGLRGRISAEPVGTYTYRKHLHLLASLDCEVEVFVLEVSAQQLNWHEKGQRQIEFVTPAEALRRISEPELARLIARLFPGAETTADPTANGC
jgi:8-oxo-dGTP pyrophosphatase MutT (NUDIX family)